MSAREACRGCSLVYFLQQTVCLLSVVSMRVWGWLVGGGGREQKITNYLLSVIKNAFIRRQLALVYCFMN